jgi:hydroxyethylthiazole kinase-like uncharacterized protein yjeF
MIDDELAHHPLPHHGDETDKRDRGTVLVVGGTAETPGSMLLCGNAALRAGAGRLQLATVRSSASALAIALPEARVIALEETRHGAIRPEAVRAIADELAAADAVLVGPGTRHRESTAELVRQLVPSSMDHALVLDAQALAALRDDPQLARARNGSTVLMPNADEAQQLPGRDALSIADATGSVVALRGSTTAIAPPGGPVYVHSSGNPGLASSGSGDVLAGALVGLCARGAPALTATLWAVAAHATAGELCARRIAPLGYLARELLDVLPAAFVTRDCATAT